MKKILMSTFLVILTFGSFAQANKSPKMYVKIYAILTMGFAF